MKDEYDFSNGECGRFFQPDLSLKFPIYLEKEVMTFVEKIAQKKGRDVSYVVNMLLRGDMQIVDFAD